MRGEKGAPLVQLGDFMEWGDCMSLAMLPDPEADTDETSILLRSLVDRFGQNIRLAVAPAYSGNDRFRLERAAALAAAAGMKPMAVNDVLYHGIAAVPLSCCRTVSYPRRRTCPSRMPVSNSGRMPNGI